MPKLSEGIVHQLSSAVVLKCRDCGIKTIADFIIQDPEDLAKKIEIPYKDIVTIRRALISRSAPFPQNCLSLYYELTQSMLIIDTGCKRLNEHLKGGIYTGERSEINGPPGSGKTQFCLSVVCNLVSSSESTALYLDTSNSFVASRVEQILQKKSQADAPRKLQNIRVSAVYDIFQLLNLLQEITDELGRKNTPFFRRLKLLVIDSATPLLAPCSGSLHLDGVALLHSLAQRARLLCCEHKISVLFCSNSNSGYKSLLDAHWSTVPSLSLSVRKSAGAVHKVSAVKSCRCDTQWSLNFIITETGICDSPTA